MEINIGKNIEVISTLLFSIAQHQYEYYLLTKSSYFEAVTHWMIHPLEIQKHFCIHNNQYRNFLSHFDILNRGINGQRQNNDLFHDHRWGYIEGGSCGNTMLITEIWSWSTVRPAIHKHPHPPRKFCLADCGEIAWMTPTSMARGSRSLGPQV